MSPDLRRKNERMRRVRAWAAPFVLTVALAPGGCKKAEPDARPPGAAPLKDERPISSPHEPMSDARIAAAPADAMPWSNSTAKAVASLQHGVDGCQWIFRADCEPGVKCNPPAPRQVACPDHGGFVELLADGECRITLEPDCPVVDGVAPPCNPPAPSKLPCPPDEE
jgi:hypothetical protein